MSKEQDNQFWDKYKKVNNKLKEYFLCIPPYCLHEIDIEEMYQALIKHDKKKLFSLVSKRIYNPSQRAYQIEFVFKNCKIFHDVIPILEYSMYDVMKNNWMCAYIALMPVVETVMRKWMAEINGEKANFQFPLSVSLYKNIKGYDDEREIMIDCFKEYLTFILKDSLFLPITKYDKKGYYDKFNRQYLLHKLLGVKNFEEGSRNLVRLLLVLDVIAELYLMQDCNHRWEIRFYADPENNIDYQLRKELYTKLCMQSVGPDDLLIIYNCFLKKGVNNTNKINTISLLRLKQEIINAKYQNISKKT